MPVPVEAIAQCWATIQPFVDVLSLVSVSKSCRRLHELVVDDATGKIKSSVVKINNVLEVDADENVDWGSPSARITHYVPKLMNVVHFPSLTCLDIGFPPNVTVWNGRPVVDDQAFPAAFPMFAIEASNLNNVEELSITVNSLIFHEEGGGLQSTYEILGKNLARRLRQTRKLKRLVIKNEATFAGRYSKYSSAFLAVMVPVIQAGIRSLEEVCIVCGDVPACNDFPTAGFDFFKAVLGLQNLRKLEIQIKSFYGPLLNDFADASRSIYKALGRFPSESLEHINMPVCFLQAGEDQFHRPSISHFLFLCRAAPALRSAILWLPPECFDSKGIDALSQLMNESSSLNFLSVNFHGYKDESGILLASLVKFVEEKAPSPDLDVNIHMLRMGNLIDQSQQFAALGDDVQNKEENGEILWDFRHARSQPFG